MHLDISNYINVFKYLYHLEYIFKWLQYWLIQNMIGTEQKKGFVFLENSYLAKKTKEKCPFSPYYKWRK